MARHSTMRTCLCLYLALALCSNGFAEAAQAANAKAAKGHKKAAGSPTAVTRKLQSDNNKSHGRKLQQSCSGRITAVYCREDASGALQDIAYINTDAGQVTKGCGPDQGSSSWTKSLFLGDGESIVAVQTCNAASDGAASVTFYTDNNQQLSCGTFNAGGGGGGTPAPAPAPGNGIDINLPIGDVHIGLPGIPGHAGLSGQVNLPGHPLGRHLMSAAAAEGADDLQDDVALALPHGVQVTVGGKSRSLNFLKPQFFWWFFDHGNSPAPDNGCQLYSPNQETPWSHFPFLDSSKRGSTAEGYFIEGKGADAYLEFQGKRYYKDYGTYMRMAVAYKADPAKVGAEPMFFWHVVQPLASLDVTCGNGLITAVNNLCFNNAYQPPPVNMGVPATWSISLETLQQATGRGLLAPFASCPNSPEQVQALTTDLNTLGSQIVAASGGIISQVVFAAYNPSQCTEATATSNVTIATSGSFVPATTSVGDISAFLLQYSGTDLCETLAAAGVSVCNGTSIDFASFVVALRDQAWLQQLMPSKDSSKPQGARRMWRRMT